MNTTFFWKLILAVFTAITVYAVVAGDWPSIISGLETLGPWGWQVSFDLVIALSICNYWLWKDAKKRGINPVPYLVFTLLTGSIAVLFYLAKHAGKPKISAAAVPAE